jgi:hypothetical protein
MVVNHGSHSRRSHAGPSDSARPTLGTVLCLIALFAIGSWGSGCSSIYHRTRAQLPPEPTAELSLRVEEAKQAEHRVEQAVARLEDRLRRSERDPATEFDRLAAAAYELERRVQAASVVAERHGAATGTEAELERLRRQALHWRTFVEGNRRVDRITQLQELEALK